MIDSVVIRVHKASISHPFLLDMLLRIKDSVHSGFSHAEDQATEPVERISENLYASKITGEVFSPIGNVSPLVRLTRFNVDDPYKNGKMYGKYDLTSAHYSIAFAYDIDRDSITFSVSVPKFYFGTNVLQYIPNQYNKALFDLSKYSDFDFNSKDLYNSLTAFVQDFFIELVPKYAHKMRYSYIELSRIDLCYNQIFKTEAQARSYLRACKGIKKKYARKNLDNYSNPIRDDIFYTCNLYGFKIYHKGDEFIKNDRKHLIEANKKILNKKDKIDVQALEDLANRTLRYELTCHSKFMSDVFVNYHEPVFDVASNSIKKRYPLMRRGCPAHKARLSYFKKCKKLLAAAERANTGLHILTPKENEFYKQFSAFRAKRYKFFFNDSFAIYEQGYGYDPSFFTRTPNTPLSDRLPASWVPANISDLGTYPLNSPTLSAGLLWLLSRKFKELILQYKIEKVPTLAIIREKVKNHNDVLKARRSKGIPDDKNDRVISLDWVAVLHKGLSKYGSVELYLESLSEGDKVDRSKVWRWKQTLKLLGYDSLIGLNFPYNYDLSYKVYLDWAQKNPKSFRNPYYLINHKKPQWAL